MTDQKDISAAREALRNSTLGERNVFKSKLIKYNGSEFELRQPSIKARNTLQRDCTTFSKGEADFNPFEYLVWAVIRNTYIPGTDELVFEEADYDTLVAKPPGGFMDLFGEEISLLMNVDVGAKKKSSSETGKGN